MREDPYTLDDVPDHLKMQKMCDKAMRNGPSSLQYVPDWFVSKEGVYMWHDDYYDDNGDYWVAGRDDEDKCFKRYDDYQKQKAQKTQIEEELLPIAWHPSRWRDWCMSEKRLEKKKQKNCGDSCF